MVARLPARTQNRRRIRRPPAFVPMPAALVDSAFDYPDWVFEPKFDGPRSSSEDVASAEETMAKQTGSPGAPAALGEYEAKRNFRETPEPAPGRERPHGKSIFVIQEHDATRLHYDFRLEADGVLKSWTVTKEPSLDPADKRLAVRVEDHPLSYASFEGTIPAGHYGAGQVRVWDHGTYEPIGPVAEGLASGKLSFVLHGQKLNGRFSLVRMGSFRGESGKKDGKENWLLIKGRDE